MSNSNITVKHGGVEDLPLELGTFHRDFVVCIHPCRMVRAKQRVLESRPTQTPVLLQCSKALDCKKSKHPTAPHLHAEVSSLSADYNDDQKIVLVVLVTSLSRYVSNAEPVSKTRDISISCYICNRIKAELGGANRPQAPK